MALPSDLIDLLGDFASSQVDYLLVGGQALALHGVLRFTKDADVWLRDTPANLAKAGEAFALKSASGRPQDLLDVDLLRR